MRVVGGRFRGREIIAPKGLDVRPTSDRAREALFNRLAHAGWGRDGANTIVDAHVLDAFAGSGALGIEALSRGAAHVTFLDRDRAAIAAIERNLRSVDAEEQATVIRGDALNPPLVSRSRDLILMDPPYDQDLAAPALDALRRQHWIAPGALIVVEAAAKDAFTPSDRFTQLDSRRYGAARLLFLRAD